MNMQDTLWCGLQTKNKITIAIFLLISLKTTTSTYRVEIFHLIQSETQSTTENLEIAQEELNTSLLNGLWPGYLSKRKEESGFKMKLCSIKDIYSLEFITVTSRSLQDFYIQKHLKIVHRRWLDLSTELMVLPPDQQNPTLCGLSEGGNREEAWKYSYEKYFHVFISNGLFWQAM